jgi:cell division protein FtsA
MTISTPAIWVADPRIAKNAVDVKQVTAIDVGTTKVCTIVGQVSPTNNMEVVAYSTVPCDGLRKGNVHDVNATADAVKKSVQQIEASTGLEIKSAYVGITGSHVSFENRRSQVSAGNLGVITTAELNRQPTENTNGDPGRTPLHALTMTYTIDGERGIRNPRGMHSNNVSVDTHHVTASSAYVNKLTMSIENAGIKIDGLVLEPLASGIAILQPDEKRRGVIVVDIGGGTTDVVGFKDGRICYTGVIPVGGYQFTNDIAVTFNTHFEAAEEAKLSHGNTEIPTGTGAVRLKLPVIDNEVDIELRPPDICRLTRERALELIQMVGMKIAESGLADRAGVGIALTGGASNLPGLADLMQRKLNIRVRHGRPEEKWSMPAELSHPSYATGVGILLWSAAQPEISPSIARTHKAMSFLNRKVRSGSLWSMLRMFFNPMAVVSGRKVRS